MEPILIFVAVTLGVLAAIYSLTDAGVNDRERIRRRIAEEVHAKAPSPDTSTLFKDVDSLTMPAPTEYVVTPVEPWTRKLMRLPSLLEQTLEQAGWRWSVPAYLVATAGIAAALGAGGVWIFRGYGFVAGVAAGLALSATCIRVARRRKRERLVKQLPAAFELMSRVIKAGQSVPQALVAVAETFDEPLAGEFDRCLHQQNLGLRPEVVFRDMAERSGILELRIFVMAMTIQRQTGGNLAELLDRLSAMIRGRLRLRQQVRTLTAEGRLQGMTLAALPVIMFAVMLVINRPYAEILLDHAWLLWSTIGLMVVGMAWIRRIVNFEV